MSVPAPHTTPGPRGASGRRVRYALLTLALVAMTTVLCVAAASIGEMKRARLDVTATRAHSLSPRVRALLAGLETPHELVVVADSSRLDRAARQRVLDLLDSLARSTPNLTATWIDTSDPADRAAFEGLPARMAELRVQEIEAGRAAIDGATASAQRVASMIDGVATTLDAWPATMRDAGADAQVVSALEELAALARVRRDEVRQVASNFPVAGTAVAAGVELPDVGAARGSLGAVLPRAAESLNTVALAAEQVAKADLYAPLHTSAPGVKSAAEAARDEALRAADALNRAPRVKTLDAIRLLQSQDAAVLLSKDNVVAIRIDSLLADTGEGAAQVRFEAERAITSALAAAGAGSGGAGAPLLVLTHSEPAAILEAKPGQGDPVAPLRGVLDHLAAQGYAIREWATAVDAQRPAFAEERGSGRAVVWIVLPGASSTPDGAARMGKLATAVGGLLHDGERVLMNVGPSLLPRVGEGDPLASPFASLGLTIDSGRPLVETMTTPAGPRTRSGFRVLRANTDHPIGAAVNGLGVALLWPTPMIIGEDAAMRWTALLFVDDSDAVWAESQWPSLVQAGPGGPGATFDERVDARGGPWTVAAAGERFLEGDSAAQRVVVVGSNGWFFDAIAMASAAVDGRVALRTPGNLELLDSSLLWLAGRDDAVAGGAGASEGSRVAAIAPGTFKAVWALCVLGPATATLLLGAALRLLRG